MARGVADGKDISADRLPYRAGDGDEPGLDVACGEPVARQERPQENRNRDASLLDAEPDVCAPPFREDPRIPSRGDVVPEEELQAVAELPVDPAGYGGGEDSAPLHPGRAAYAGERAVRGDDDPGLDIAPAGRDPAAFPADERCIQQEHGTLTNGRIREVPVERVPVNGVAGELEPVLPAAGGDGDGLPDLPPDQPGIDGEELVEPGGVRERTRENLR